MVNTIDHSSPSTTTD